MLITADHGDHLGEHHFVGHSVSLYDVLVHVPLIVRDPTGSLPRGTTVEQFVSTRRLFHTVLTAAGLAEGDEAAFDLVHHGETDPDQGMVFSEAVTPQNVLNIMQKFRPDLVRERAVRSTAAGGDEQAL